MAKILCAVFKNSTKGVNYERMFYSLFKRLEPENITPFASKVFNNNGVFVGILNLGKNLAIQNGGVCIGRIFFEGDGWYEPKTKIPEGTFALFRSNERYFEAASDFAGSRTIWYMKNDDAFFASTSQRAIVYFLNSFSLNTSVIPWMLSSGSIGPYISWDKRIRCLGPHMSVVLDRQSWDIVEYENDKVDFRQDGSGKEYKEYENELIDTLEKVFSQLKVNSSDTVSTLSGGYDTRAILLFLLKNNKKLSTVTWGLCKALSDRRSDAYIAKSVAKHLNLENKYYETDIADEPIDSIFNRFLCMGEGRVEDISAYMDGFRIFKDLFERNFCEIIRGDECLGWLDVYSPSQALRMCGISYLHDFANLPDFNEFGFKPQKLPDQYQQLPSESLLRWRDRIFRDFRVPFIEASFADIIQAYLEVINPFLTKCIITLPPKWPDVLRRNKKLFSAVVTNMSPKIPFAYNSAIASHQTLMQQKRIVDYIRDELDTAYARSILPPRLIKIILEKMVVSKNVTTFRGERIEAMAKKVLPMSAVKLIEKIKFSKRVIDMNILAFRVYIICKMNKILTEDSKGLDQT